MRISVPRDRAYYRASQNEPERLLCWIPPDEIQRLAAEGHIRQDAVADFPDGLEVEVSPEGFAELGINLGIEPQAIKEAYLRFAQRGMLPASGMVDGVILEEAAGSERSGEAFRPPVPMGARDVRPTLPEPDMTDGADPMTALRHLLSGKEG